MASFVSPSPLPPRYRTPTPHSTSPRSPNRRHGLYPRRHHRPTRTLTPSSSSPTAPVPSPAPSATLPPPPALASSKQPQLPKLQKGGVERRTQITARQTVAAGAAATVATAVLLRRRLRRDTSTDFESRDDGGEDDATSPMRGKSKPPPPVTDFLDQDADLDDTSSTTGAEFSGSRAAWNQDADGSDKSTAPSPASAAADEATGATSTPPPSSSVYSYTYRSPSRRAKQSFESDEERDDAASPASNGAEGTDAAMGKDMRTAFRHMRDEFESDSGGPDSDTTAAATSASPTRAASRAQSEPGAASPRGTPTTPRTGTGQRPPSAPRKRRARPRPLTGGELLRRVAGVPISLLQNVILPLGDVASVLWHDARSVAIDVAEGRTGPFLTAEEVEDMAATAGGGAASASWGDSGEGGEEEEEFNVRFVDEDEGEDEAELSMEERQIRDVQKMAGQAAGTVGKTMRQLGRFLLS